MNKKISVVIPLYNSSDYIEQCIHSIQKQTYSDIEIILVNDGSTDDTDAICRQYLSEDNRIQYISIEHGGVSKARNAGLAVSKGYYVTFIDNDDYIDKNLLLEYGQMCSVCKEQEINPAWIMCGMQATDVSRKKKTTELRVFEDRDDYTIIRRNQVASLSWKMLFNFVTNKLYLLSTIKNNGICFNEDIHIAEDLQFNLDYLRCSDGDFAFINKPLYHYVRRNGNCLSLSYYEDAIIHTKKIYNEYIRMAENDLKVDYDGIMVIKSIYIFDWVSRLTSLYESDNISSKKHRNKYINQSIKSDEFQELLKEVHKVRKISNLRYNILKLKDYRLFYCFRTIYRSIFR